MKRLLLSLTILTLAFGASAQFLDASINPIGALFLRPSVAVELPLTENIGIEPNAGLIFGNNTLYGGDWRRRGFSVGARGKYYFSPEEDNDGFYGNVYARLKRTNFSAKDTDFDFDYSYKRTRIAVGLGGGYKYVARNGLVLDVGVGVGRAIVNRYVYDDDDAAFFTVGDVFSSITNFDFDGRLSIGYRIGN